MSVKLKAPGRGRAGFPPIIPVVSIVLLIVAGGLFTLELQRFSDEQVRLAAGVRVAGVDVSDLLPAEAVNRWERTYAEPIVLYYEDSPILLDPGAIGFRTNREQMLAEARSISDVEVGFWVRFFNHLLQQEQSQGVAVPLYAEYQANLLEQYLRDIAIRYDRPSGAAGYDVATLTTFAGSGGYQLDIPRAMTLIDEALRRPNNRMVVLPTGGTDATRPRIETLRDLIIAYLDAEGFIYDGTTTVASVFILDLQTGEEVNLLGDVAFSAASTVKVSIMIDYFRTLDFAPSPEEAWLMANSLLCSNNSSSNLIMQIIGNNDIRAGLTNVSNTAAFVGARNTYIAAPFVLAEGQAPISVGIPQTAPNPNFNTDADPFNQTTTEDLATQFAMIYDCANYGSGLMTAYGNNEFTQQECRRMLNLMSANDLERMLQGGIPQGVTISHKNGWLGNVHGDAGIVFPPNGRNYVIAVFLWEQGEFFSFDRAWPLMEGISRATWNYFSPDQPMLTPRGDLPVTAQECEGNFLPPDPSSVNLDDINAWRNGDPSPIP
jgi:hypothetical protein